MAQNQITSQTTPRYKVSDPSQSIDEVNVPEISGLTAEFIYNFYTFDERVKPFETKNLPLGKLPRYVLINWNAPILSDFELSVESRTKKDNTGQYSIENNASRVLSEDNFFNPNYVNHTFSNIDIIEQGATDLEAYSRLLRHDTESLYQMSKYQIEDMASRGDPNDKQYEKNLGSLTEDYMKLADFPKSALGLRVYDSFNNLNDSDDLIRSISDSVSLSMKINSCVIPDIFENSSVKGTSTNLESLKIRHAESQSGTSSNVVGLNVEPVKNESVKNALNNLKNAVNLIGYVIDRYLVDSDGFKKDSTFFVEDIRRTSFVDQTVLYGISYVYTIRVVAEVKILTYSSNINSQPDLSTLYISSRPMSVPVECYEYVPPPEPNNLKFIFDYVKRNLLIQWDTPVNPQKDIKQFQVFRRKTIKEPFELIAQYGFDRSISGPGGNKYVTGEKVDANNVKSMSEDLRYLVKNSEFPVYMHRDEEFTVDTEFLVSSAYIYAICAIDAHGMISNYSTQYYVTFDPYKNRLITKDVCDAGSPKQYPNMKLRMDAFKDVIKVSGDNARQMNVYFTPEYLKVSDAMNPNIVHKIVEAQTNNDNHYYVLQLINLDNQKSQILKINIKDPQNLTVQ